MGILISTEQVHVRTDKLLDESDQLTSSGEKCPAAQMTKTTNIRKGGELG